MGAAGTPIRLVQESGRRIELMATELQITTNRKVGQIPLPMRGSQRFGMDFNMNNCTIMASGIIVDDKISSTDITPRGYIDFNTSGLVTGFGQDLFLGTDISYDDIRTAYDGNWIRLEDASGNEFFIKFIKGTTGSGGVSWAFVDVSGTDYFSITMDGPSDTSKTDIVTDLAAIINSTAYSSKPGNSFTATVSGSPFPNLVHIVADVAGAITTSTPDVFSTKSAPDDVVVTGQRPQGAYIPIVRSFYRGSREVKRRSAGDKVQDLLGIMNNSNDSISNIERGVVGVIGALTATIGIGIPLLMTAMREDVGDYIRGIEIPFKSFVNATSGQESDVRVFHMPTGSSVSENEKGAEAALAPHESGPEGDDTQNIGLLGAVQSLDMNYSAGETVYNFTLTFLPVDYLM